MERTYCEFCMKQSCAKTWRVNGEKPERMTTEEMLEEMASMMKSYFDDCGVSDAQLYTEIHRRLHDIRQRKTY